MPKKYPHLYRKLIINYYKSNKNVANTINTFKISNGSLFNWIKNNPKDNILYNRNRKVTPRMICYIRTYVITHINFNYKLLLRNIKRNFKVSISKTTLYNRLKTLNITRKKVYRRYIYKKSINHTKDIIEFTKNIKLLNKDDIISIDECHFNNTQNINYGWSIKGQKIFIKKYLQKKERYSLICAISNKKVIEYKIIKNSVNGEIYLNFVKSICNKVNNKILLMDNARIHHYTKLKEFMKSSTNTILYNVPYMPEYNPIENCFSKIKNDVFRNTQKKSLIDKITKSLNNIPKKYLGKIFKNSFKDF